MLVGVAVMVVCDLGVFVVVVGVSNGRLINVFDLVVDDVSIMSILGLRC
tara:strand:- start:107 stop:253 length:147 start_codon:yes stop_codon:yes gene_type:complete